MRMMVSQEQEQLDEITVGNIRIYYESILDEQIVYLTYLIKKGYHNRHEAEKFLNGPIGQTLTHLDNIKAFASYTRLNNLTIGEKHD